MTGRVMFLAMAAVLAALAPVLAEAQARRDAAARERAAREKREPFDPSKAALEAPDLCVVLRGVKRPACAAVAQGQAITLDPALFDGPSGDTETTCRRVPEMRRGSDGTPVKVWLDVCEGDAEEPLRRERALVPAAVPDIETTLATPSLGELTDPLDRDDDEDEP